MAADPQFISVANVGIVSVSTANTARDGSGTVVTAWTAGASGGKVNRVVLKATGQPADSIVTMFINDGGGLDLFDEFDLGAPAAASTTVTGFRMERVYDDLVLEAGYIVAFAITVALSSGVIIATVLGGDF